MRHYRSYIDRQKSIFPLSNLPASDAKIGVVIPAYKEPDIISTLSSLANAISPTFPVIVVVVINSEIGADDQILAINRQTIRDISLFHSFDWLFINVIELENVPLKIAGVGNARKTGLDAIIAYFYQQGIHDGLLLCLDADTTVAENYFIEIEKFWQENPTIKAFSIYFEHSLKENKEEITQYELYLRYYRFMLRRNGYPKAFYAIGSAMGFPADSYVKVGGMKQLKAGEDFYILQKMNILGDIEEINTTGVYPSDRLSDRTPFGTGQVLDELKNGSSLYVFSPQSFQAMKEFYVSDSLFWEKNDVEISEIFQTYSQPVNDFLNEWDAARKIVKLVHNCTNNNVFRKRFYDIFNPFFYLKYLNFVHPKYYPKVPIKDAINEVFFEIKDFDLFHFRRLDKAFYYRPKPLPPPGGGPPKGGRVCCSDLPANALRS